MKLYYISNLKNHIKNNYPELSKKEVESFFSPAGLYDTNSVKNVYLFKNKKNTTFIDENETEKLMLLATLKFKTTFDISTVDSIPLNDSIKVMHCSSYKTYIDCLITHNKSPSMVEKFAERKEMKKKAHPGSKECALNKGNLDVVLKNKKIVSVDFEYFVEKKPYTLQSCSEIGIAIQDNDKTYYEHYVFEDMHRIKSKNSKNLQNKFQFGQTQYIQTEKINTILKNHLKDADYLLFHDLAIDMTILQNSGFKFENTTFQVLDTLEMQYNLQLIADKAIPEKKMSLMEVLKYNNIDFIHLHNSGNDAAYTLQALLAIKQKHEDKKELAIKTASPIIDSKQKLKSSLKY